jgi:hypothetical protein
VTQDEQPDRTPGSGMSRDTLLLLGALTFLILAVVLTFLFTPGGDDQGASATATAIAAAPTAAPVDTYPSPAGVPTAPPDGAYPSPGSLPTVAPAYPSPGDELTPTAELPAAIPTGDPLAEATPTVDPLASGYPAPTNGVAGGVIGQTPENSAYPGPVGEGTPPALPTFNPTVIQPTAAPPPPLPTAAPPVAQAPTSAPAPTVQPPPAQPTDTFELEATSAPVATAVPTTPPPPPPPPADVLRGNVRWSAGQSPIILRRDVQIAPGAELIIEPGVEVQLEPGVSIYVDGGRLLALGLPDRPIRFTGTSRVRWSGIFGRPNSFVVLENAEIRGGGAGGTVMAVDRSELIVRGSRFNDNGGAILLTETKLEMLNSEVSGNDMPFGAALEATYGRGNFITMRGNRFGGNRLSPGAPQVRVSNTSTFDTLNLTIEGNLLRGGTPNLQLSTSGPLRGTVTCNALVGDGQGFSLRTQTPQVAPNGVPPMDLRIESNIMDEHIPPVIPVYLRYGLGRGATSEIMLDMRNNWWGEPTGPYEPDENADGRGDSVGENIIFAPWLTEPPPCAPAG